MKGHNLLIFKFRFVKINASIIPYNDSIAYPVFFFTIILILHKLLLKSLLDKSVIEVDGLKRIAKNYARTFRAAISQYDYFFQEDFRDMP